MTRAQALPYVSFIADDAGRFSPMKQGHFGNLLSDNVDSAVLVGWECDNELLFVAVKSYLPGIVLDAGEAVELATDGLKEAGWCNDDLRPPDYVLLPEGEVGQ